MKNLNLEAKSKKSQSQIIITILIILILLVIIVIVYNVVKKTVETSSREVDIQPLLFKGNLEYSMYGDDGGGNYKNILVKVTRGSGGGEINGIKLIFEALDGNRYNYESELYPNELETKEYYINVLEIDSSGTLVGFNKIKSISIYYLYGEEKISSVLEKKGVDGKTTSPEIGTIKWYKDYDIDGYGCAEGTEYSTEADCENVEGTCVPNNRDCDDSNVLINPSQSEIMDNQVDENCDGAFGIDKCMEIYTAGTYKLYNDINVPIGSDCFYIYSDNVVLDLNEHTIEGTKGENSYCYWGYCWAYQTQSSCDAATGCYWMNDYCNNDACSGTSQTCASSGDRCVWRANNNFCYWGYCWAYQTQSSCDAATGCYWRGSCKYDSCLGNTKNECLASGDRCAWYTYMDYSYTAVNTATENLADITIKNGQMKNLGYPIYGYGNQRLTIENLDIINDVVLNSWSDLIYLSPVYDSKLNNIKINTPVKNAYRGIYLYGDNNEITNVEVCGLFYDEGIHIDGKNNIFDSIKCDSSYPDGLCSSSC